MAVTILERPRGYILDSVAVSALATDSSGDVLFGAGAHGMTDGDVIYMVTSVGDYNGFFEVDVTSVDTFKIISLSTGDYIEFIKEITGVGDDVGEFYKANYTHGWSCVHLPITYRLSTNLYPTNSSDTTRTVSSVQDASGYTVILLSGSLGSAVNSYDFVKLTLPSDTELSGVYQILEWISSTVMIINLEYDTANNFTSATALKHYNNYNIIVRVYAGINSSHQWTAQKPYELAATLLFIPDENNEAFFSINELLKSYIETRNNLILGTLPNNIDFWTNFYIETAESYDDSDGYVFGTTTSSYTSDQANFEGTAVNAKLEFKNLQSGYLSDYLMTNNTAKFLTLFTIPVLFACGDDTPNCYSDISFLSPVDGLTLTVKQQYYANGNAGAVTNTTITNADQGVIRTELTPNCAYDRVDVTVLNSGITLPAVTAWSNADNGGGVAWVAGVSGLNNVIGVTSDFWYIPFMFQAGVTYTFTYQITISESGDWDSSDFFGDFTNDLTASFPGVGSGGDSDNYNSIGVKNGTFVITPTESGVGYFRLHHEINILGTPASGILQLDSMTVAFTSYAISETQQFKMDCICQKQEIRLTWLNNLGGFDYWAFTGKKDDIVEIQEAMTTKKNILPTWPKSYGADADTIKKQTLRVSNKAYTVRSQFLTEDELNAISFIKSSILVQIVNSRNDRRTVLVDTDSFVKRKDGDKTFEVAFNISFTDDIPVQTL